MDKNKKVLKIFSILLSVLIISNILPMQVFAEEVTSLNQENTVIGETAETETTEAVEAEREILSEEASKREEYVKHFRMSDGTYKAAQYDTPVHYLDENGKWVDYDNSLTEIDCDTERSLFAKDFVNTKSDVEIRLSKKTNGSKLVRMKTEDFSVSWNFEDIKKVTGKVTEQLADDGDPTTLEKLNSEVIYEDVFENVDLQYILTSGFLKENIILKDKDVATEFYVNYKNPNLIAKLYDEKTIALCDENDNAIFVINAPYMQDAEGHTSDGITLLLAENQNGRFTLKMNLDEEWLNSEGVVYPVTVDPIMTTSQKWDGTSTCDSAFVAAGYPDTTFGRNGSNPEGSLYVGYEESFTSAADRGAVRSFLKCNLPQLGVADKVVDAKLYLYLRASSTSNCVNVFKVTSAWQSNNISWNNQPTVDGYLKIDYLKMVLWQEHEWKIWEITDLVRGWYSGYITNHGIMLKADSEADGAGRAWFYSDYYTTAAAARPFIVISYRNMSGYEDYYSYTTISAGRGGTASVNNYNGNFVYSQYLTEDCGGEIMPVNISLVYNSNKSGSNYANMGNGVQSNYHLFIKPNPNITDASVDEVKKYKYYLNDADGTEHYFYFEDLNGETGKDEDGLGYELWVNPENNTSADLKWVKYKITDKDKNTMEFNRYGWLIKITSSVGKQINIDHEFQPDTENLRIKSIWDGVLRGYTFSYNDANQVSSITDPANRVTALTYSGNHLSNITFPDGKTVSFHRVNYGDCWDFIYAPDKYTAIAYNRASVQKAATEIGNFTWDARTLDYYAFEYKQNETKVTDSARRKYTYQFNDYGQTTGIISDNSGHAQFFSFAPGNSTSSNANKLNTSSKIQTSTLNYLKNTSFNNNNEHFSIYATTPYPHYHVIYNSVIGNFGAGSIEVKKTISEGLASAVQDSEEVPAGAYTLSAYFNTGMEALQGNAFLTLQIVDVNTGVVESSSVVRVGSTNGSWGRLSVTAEVGQGKKLRLLAGLDENAIGTVWIDNVQLESGYGATSYNLIENSGFKNQGHYWSLLNSNLAFSEHISECEVTTLEAGTIAGQTNAFYSRATSPSAYNYLSQIIDISGKKGDVFSLGGWARAASAPLNNGTKPENESPQFDILFEFYDANGQLVGGKKKEFNPDVDNWQFNSFMAIAPADYSYCIYFVEYNKNINNLYFTGGYCYKEVYGQTYTYDDNGNIVSSQDLAKTESSFAYSNNQMTKLLNPSGSRYMYSYDEQNKLNYAFSSDGQLYGFEYDTNGNVKDTYISPLKPATAIVANKQYYIVNAGTGKALDSGTASSGADEVTCQSYHPYPASQKWYVLSAEDNNTFELGSIQRTAGTPSRDNADTYYLKVSGESNSNGKVVMTNNSYYNGDNQYFKPIKNDDGTFTLYMKKSGYEAGLNGEYKCLNCAETEAVDSTPKNTVYEATCDQNNLKETMKWYFYEVPYDNNKYLSTHASYTENGNFTTSVTDVNGSTTFYSYNVNNGLLAQSTAPNEATTIYSYNMNNNQMSSVYSCGINTAYTYDNVGRLSKITSSAVTAVNNLEYNFTYDSYGRLQTISVGNQSLMTTTYDQYHRPTIKIYGNNQYFTTYYDALDRVVEIRYNNDTNKRITYGYASNGNLGMVIDYFSATKTQYGYDLAGRVVDVRTYGTTDLNNYSNVNSSVSYYYADKTNYLKGMTHWSPETGTQIYDYVYGDVSQGQMPDQVYSVKLNGQAIQGYDFDELGRLTRKTTTTTSNLPVYHLYSYRDVAASNQTTTQVQQFLNRLGTYTYTYDDNGNISQEVFEPWGSGLQSYTKTYRYDEFDQLLWCQDTLGNAYGYTYDKAGNLTFKEAVNTEKVYTTGNYSYSNASWRDQLTSYNGEAIAYDAIGNPTTYRGASLTWSEGRRLTSYSKNNTNLVFEYDADGKRIKKAVNSMDNYYKYIYNQGTLVGIATSTGGTLLTFVCDENGDYIGFTYGGAVYYYVRNLQNDVVAIVDANQNVVVTYSYDPWGNCTTSGALASTIGDINPIRYRGYFYDTETGLYYLQSRYYDPQTGRFLNADEPEILLADDVSLLQSNLYAYCWNNPVVNKDSSGYWVETALDVAFIVGDVASIVANPANVIGYVELAADVVGLVVPGMTGGGKIVRVVMNSDNLVDAMKLADNVVDTKKAIKSSTELGQKLHKMYDPIKDAASGKLKKLNKTIGDKVRLRPDAVDESNKIIYELKPFNKNSYKKALKQVQKYVDELGGKWNVVLDFYMR